MSNLRHGIPPMHQGWLSKLSPTPSQRKTYRRFLKLHDTILSNHHSPHTPPSWEISLLEVTVTRGTNPREIDVCLPKRRLTYCADTQRDFEKWMGVLEKGMTRGLDKYYRIDRRLGEGAFAVVFGGVDVETGEAVAIKRIDKEEYTSSDALFLAREVRLAQSLDLECIVKTIDIFDTKRYLYMVMEFMGGGELFDIIADRGKLSEREASRLIKSLIRSVDEIHERGIVHSDIKPENVLCVDREWPLVIKLCDFGLAKDLKRDVGRRNNGVGLSEGRNGEIELEGGGRTGLKLVGTPGYVAPEVVNMKECGKAVDMWACGVILYILLSGKMPFYGHTDAECLKMTAKGEFEMPDSEWSQISEAAKSLVKSLLQVNPDRRLLAKAALQHRWLSVPEEFSADPINNDLSDLHSNRRKLKRAVHAAISVGRLRNIVQAARISVAPG